MGYRGLDWSGAELTEVLFLSLKGNIQSGEEGSTLPPGGAISHALNALHGVKKGAEPYENPSINLMQPRHINCRDFSFPNSG